ncbi:MAG: CHAT domain-containing protein, partial [Gemmatimonadaceae bacterium]|nr:CHAT domain-containing protein [Gemmatimonadaceae bacterium]
LNLATTAGVTRNTLLNLGALGRNLEFLAHHEAAGQYYDQLLQMLSSSSRTENEEIFTIPAAMHHVLHGDQARGEAILREWIRTNLEETNSHRFRREPLEQWAYEALHYLGMHFIATGRPQEAIQLAEKVNRYKPESADEQNGMYHGLVARAFLGLGQLDRALEELARVHDVESPQFSKVEGAKLEILDLWIDIARIHVAKQDYEKAMAAYVALAYNLGGLIADPRAAPTVRWRFYWLQQMTFVVHEMISVWMIIADAQTRQMFEATVGNALLQLKGNLFVALGFHRGPFGSIRFELFTAARKYAVAARKVISRPGDAEAFLELEEALREREEVERSLSTADINPSPASAEIFSRDFRSNYLLTEESLCLDYSLVDCHPPQNGLAGASGGLRYIGVGLTAGNLRVVDLGEAHEIETLCRPLIQALSTQPLADEGEGAAPEDSKQLAPAPRDQLHESIDHEDVAKRVFSRIVAPFEPLPRALSFSSDGVLSALPFHALIRNGRYLVEDKDVAYCYSVLQREMQYYRQLSSSGAVRPPVSRSALLLGDPSYSTSSLEPLSGTKIEVSEVGILLRSRMSRSEDNRFPLDEVRVKTGADATVSQLLAVYQPVILHIAAHGRFDAGQIPTYASRSVAFGRHYRWWQQVHASCINELDNALLHSVVMLADEPNAIGDPADGGLLTALELSSLNLFFTLVVLSACDTGAGVTESGAGVLGFQYAILASGAEAGLLSLWKILDEETSSFMIDFYQYQSDRQGAKAAYLAAVRKHCRRDGHRLHPYYWAALVFLDQERGHVR